MSKTLPAALITLVALQSTASAAADFNDLIRKIPRGANMVLAIDVDKVLASKIAKDNGWGSRTGNEDRPIYLPQEAGKVVVAAMMDPGRDFSRAWEVALMSLKESLPMRLIAKAEGGYTDNINGVEAAWIPSDAYFLQLAPEILGLMYPSNRQAVSRWADRKAKSTTMEASDFLVGAVGRVKRGPQMVLALDTKDVVQPHTLYERLKNSEVVEKYKLDVNETAEIISSMKGLVMEISFANTATANVQIEFDKAVTFNERAAKAFVLAALTQHQAELPGTESWNCAVSGNSILFNGEIEPDALRRVLSMIDIPSTKFSSLRGQDTGEASADQAAQATLQYYKSITTYINDLQKHAKSHNGDNYWMDRYAKKIDRLPILHVDADLLDFGQKTAQTLRVMSNARKTGNIRAGVREGNISAASEAGAGGYGYGYGAYGYGYGGSGYVNGRWAASYGNARATLGAQSAAKKQEDASATGTKIEGFKLINDAMAEIRRVMTDRYQIEFP